MVFIECFRALGVSETLIECFMFAGQGMSTERSRNGEKKPKRPEQFTL